MNRNIRKILFGIFGMMLCLFVSVTPAKADEKTDAQGAMLYVTSYSVTNETIIPGKEFTLKLKIENFSSKIAAKNAVLMIDNPEGIVPEYGTVSVVYLDTIAPKGTKELKFKYSADSAIEATELDFGVYIKCDTQDTSTPLRIAVGREGDIAVKEFTVPEKYTVGRAEYISALVENVSGKDINNAVLVVKCDDNEIASETIGTMSVGTSKTQYVSVTFDAEGQHSYEIIVRYTNGDGESKEFTIDTGMLTVSEDNTVSNIPSKQDNVSNTQEATEQNGMSNIVIICTIGVLMIVICCIILLLLYRRK